MEWSLDLVTNLGPPNTPKYHLLAAICCFSKFCILRLIPDKTSSTVASELRQALIGPFGTPQVFRTDNGTEFAGAVSTLCTTHKIKHKRSSPYTSHSNGQVERLHRTVETLLRRALVTLPHEHWPDLVPDIQLAVNTTYARSIGCPPYLIMFGTTPPDLSMIPDPTSTPLETYARAI